MGMNDVIEGNKEDMYTRTIRNFNLVIGTQ